MSYITAVLRIATGGYLLFVWIQNVQKGFYTPAGYERLLTSVFPQSHNPLTWYASFVTTVVLPHKELFANVQFVFELVLALALFFGILTPVFGTLGALWTANLYFATFGAESPLIYIILFFALVVCVISRAGRTLGIDAYLVTPFGDRSAFW